MTKHGETKMYNYDPKLKGSLCDAVARTIEEMTFQPIDEIIEEQPEPTTYTNTIWAILPLNKPLEGEMLIEFPLEYAKNFTINMYSLEDDNEVKDEMINDLVAELANTIGGRFLGEFVPPDQDFSLGIPKTGAEELPYLDEVAIRIKFRIEDDNFTVIVTGTDYKEFKS